TITAPGVLGNDTDADGDSLTAAVSGGGTTNGTLTFNSNGSFTYTPNANFVGTDSFQYTANDGTVDSNIATVTLTISATANTAPVTIEVSAAGDTAPTAVNDAYSTAKNTPLTVDAATGVLVNDTDPEGDTLKAVLASGPSHGTLTLNANGGFTYTPTTGYV